MGIITMPEPKPPYSFKETLWFLDRNLDDCMHEVRPGSVRKALRTSKGNVLFEITGSENALVIEQLAGPRTATQEIKDFVEQWFDLSRDLHPFYRLLDRDKDFAPLAKKYRGFKIVGIPDLYECLVWCIAGQQINLSFAYTLKRRLVESSGTAMIFQDHKHWLFPKPQQVLDLGHSALRKMQFTGRKAEYIITISQAFADGSLNKTRLAELGDENEMLQQLLRFRGIGIWSASYALMKSMRAMRMVPIGDAGLKQALMKFKGIQHKETSAITKIFEPFSDWETYLTFYLWRSLREMA